MLPRRALGILCTVVKVYRQPTLDYSDPKTSRIQVFGQVQITRKMSASLVNSTAELCITPSPSSSILYPCDPPSPSSSQPSGNTPRKLTKEEVRQYRQLGLSILKVVEQAHIRKIIAVRYDDRFYPSSHSSHSSHSLKRDCIRKRRDLTSGYKRDRWEGMSTLAAVSETATVVA